MYQYDNMYINSLRDAPKPPKTSHQNPTQLVETLQSISDFQFP